jgi:hypothetical protein
MNRTKWLALSKRPKIDLEGIRRPRSLEGRIVLCVDCDGSRTLTVSSSGNLVCSSCGSEHWMFVAVPLIAGYSEYGQPGVLESLAVDRYIARLEKEALSASCEQVESLPQN